MKRLLFTLFFSITATTTILSQEFHSLTISFRGIKNNKGAIFVGVHNQKNNFLKKHYKEAIVKITNNKAFVIFKGLPPGEYAVSAFHDENNNNKMDTNFLGIPIEPIGISNDAKGFMGPPKYKHAKFLITTDITTHITLN